ncbi:MAG: type IX secretion system sortase PorU [Bacteroidales bacterium]
MRFIFSIIIFISSFCLAFSQSVLKSGEWAQIRVKKSGIYKISYADLTDMGFSDFTSVSVYGNTPHELSLINSSSPPPTLQEIPIRIFQSNNTSFSKGDYVLFYGQSSEHWELNESLHIFTPHKHSYTDYNYYYITVHNNTALSVQKQADISDNADYTCTSYDAYAYHEENNTNLLHSGRIWYEYFSEKTISFPIDNYLESEKVHAYMKLAGRNPEQSIIQVSINNNSFDDVILSSTPNRNPYARKKDVLHSFFSEQNDVSIKLKSTKSGPDSETYLDYASIQYSKHLTYTNNQFRFRSLKSFNNASVTNFDIESSEKVSVWDISDPLHPIQIPTKHTNNTTTFKTETSSLKEFIAFRSDFLHAEFVSKITNQDILSHSNIDMIIVAPTIFHSYADTLAHIHNTYNNLNTVIVTPEEIFNEFSSGKPDIAAIRNYARYMYLQDSSLKYMLLFGDGSYDNRNFENSDFHIPTFQSRESCTQYSSFVSDDFFGMLEDNEGVTKEDKFIGDLDIAIGRFPVNTPTEAAQVTNKTIQYITNKNYRGEWQNDICFVADDADENQTFHMKDADRLAERLTNAHPEFNTHKIYLDAYKQSIKSVGQFYPEANSTINNTIKKGVLIVNYTGHGSEVKLAAENAFNKSIVSSWKNSTKLPLFITASCEVSRFDDHSLISLGEYMLLEKNGGAIALFSTTRVVFAFSNFMLNNNIYKTLFSYNEQTNKPYTIGEAFVEAKKITPNDYNQNKRSFTLLGDPALTLAFPQYSIVIDSINDQKAEEFSDTLKAKSVHTIKGHIENYAGTTVNTYNGELFVRLFDKKQHITTLGNDGNDTFDFTAFTNIIFQGKADISDGYFNTSFIIPQDIFYYPGNGKLNLFANNGTIQAKGNYNNMPIFGTYADSKTDKKGPDIRIYMNDTLFKNNQQTHENPKLLVDIFDSSGVNISNASIGHDISVTLESDNHFSQLYLNDFYSAENNSFVSGSLEYPFTDLEPGNYTLTIQVWDTYNNMSEESISFSVHSQDNINISSLYNYPNPLRSHTTFRFTHNQAQKNITVYIHIYDITGKLLKKIKKSSFAGGFTDESIYWDGTLNSGEKIQHGIYPYTLTLKTEDGQETLLSKKILVLQ